MTLGFMLLGFGAIMLYAGMKNMSVGDALAGVAPTADPQSPEQDAALVSFLSAGPTGDASVSAAGSLPQGGAWGGSKAVVDRAIAIGQEHGLRVVSTKRATRTTLSGGMSDHYSGNKNAYAADQSNGSHPTPEMDAAAAAIAQAFGLSWHGSGLAQKVVSGFRLQMIYRSMIGGNHFNHIHFGAKRV